MSKNKLLAAKEFIEAKEYNVARNILEAIPEDTTAKKWLTRLNELYPKPKSVEEMSDEELLQAIDREDVLNELKKRIRKMYSAVTSEWSNEEKRKKRRQELSEFINHIITLLPKFVDTLGVYNLDDLLVYALQSVSEMYISLSGEPELDTLATFVRHENADVRVHARTILWKLDSLKAKLIRLATTNNGYNITWAVPDIKSLSNTPLPILEVYKSNNKIFTVTITNFTVHFPSWDWTREHFEIASLVFEAAYNIWDGLVQDAMSIAEENEIIEEGRRTYEEDIAPYLDDYEEEDDFDDENGWEEEDEDEDDYEDSEDYENDF